jgi:hypothetical protein
MSGKYDILYLLVIPINLFYHFTHKYLYDKNKLSTMIRSSNKSNSKTII